MEIFEAFAAQVEDIWKTTSEENSDLSADEINHMFCVVDNILNRFATTGGGRRVTYLSHLAIIEESSRQQITRAAEMLTKASAMASTLHEHEIGGLENRASLSDSAAILAAILEHPPHRLYEGPPRGPDTLLELEDPTVPWELRRVVCHVNVHSLVFFFYLPWKNKMNLYFYE